MAQWCETGAGPAREETGNGVIVRSIQASGVTSSPPPQQKQRKQHWEGCVWKLWDPVQVRTLSPPQEHVLGKSAFFSLLIHQFVISIRAGTVSYCLKNQISN